MRRCFLLMMATCLFAVGCSKVTETGNPCQPEGCAEAASQDSKLYNNEIYRVSVYYPATWNADDSEQRGVPSGCEGTCEQALVDNVLFSNAMSTQATVTVYFLPITGEYSTLLKYLQQIYPAHSFVQYDGADLTAYYYDDPAPGANGGDMRDYFFSDGQVLVIAEVEFFQSAEAEISTILRGISFY